MAYLINQTIIFNDGEGTLSWRDREGEAISLSAPIARILATLIDNPGVTLSRELLLREALEKYSLSPSISNLNNYISLLRKVLRNFGLAEAIVTVPKSGIVFHVDSIEAYSRQQTDVRTVGNSVGNTVETSMNEPVRGVNPPVAAPDHSAPRFQLGYTAKIIFIIGMILLFILIMVSFSGRFPYRHFVRVNMINKCDVFALQDAVNRESIAGYQDLCGDHVLFISSKTTPLQSSGMKKNRIIIACSKRGKGCITYVEK
ncbi:winged helix-turn-helix domain-containing protein [Candidatus Symbiopectobacterium sp. NZEC135]|uniref:winged helix-turn-helix domain-containing protein n=1 Tax=Candidatus Symbiopectobacterium sp. NZEC135 TaxID=2820471 RepID=UPI00222728A7|nr:winged helix-turn-helix domain-containing protein [Candidatus Symbiopectobacterium sp. NZEC135]MCW2479286.1 winged helix-turn-helix domain-containing protein [Candidatus Symbiopectobacterium sp. NZEC135]